jgi:hypothetical protein
MNKVRKVIQNKDYFENFLLDQPKKVQDKLMRLLRKPIWHP